MKKKILLLLLACLMLLPVASCAREKHDLLYETTVGPITYCVRGKNMKARQIVLKAEGEVIWADDVKVSSSVGSMGGTYGFEVLDLNFDGYQDFMIADKTAGKETSYLCWLWHQDEGVYRLNEDLSGLCNIRADRELKAIFAFSHTYEFEEAYLDAPASQTTVDSTTKYEWKDGRLTPSIRASIAFYSESKLYCYSVAYYDEELGRFGDSDDNWMTPEEYKTYDMSFLYYFE